MNGRDIILVPRWRPRELQACTIPSVPPKNVAKCISKIDEAITLLEELEKITNSIPKAMTQFWMRVVQDDQLQQLGAQLNEAEA